MSYITLDEHTYCELLVFEDERDGLHVGGETNEGIALTELCRLARTHPDTSV
jgi:hypothetical protein